MNRAAFPFLLLAALTQLQVGAAQDEVSFEILPTKVALFDREDRQQLILQSKIGDRFQTQLREAVFTSTDEKVARVEDGVVIPVADGQCLIEARIGDKIAEVKVEVSGQKEPFRWSFRNHVESVLSKQGCNGGACHGARAGKNGFRLTLFGFDLNADYSYLTRQAGRRRINFAEPGRSLFLTKPTGLLPHKGGVRLDVSSREYQVLSQWIAAGAPGPQQDDPKIERLEVLPEYSRQSIGAKQQLLLIAHFSDGTHEDVTSWAKFTSVNTSVATVNNTGEVSVVGPGEGAIKLWYLNYNAMAFITAPYPGNIDTKVFADSPTHNFIDEHVVAKLKSLNAPPSPQADDASFLRRAYLDSCGILPTEEETRAFLADQRKDKRERLIDELLSRSEFVDYWAYQWSDLLLVSGARLRPKAVESYYGWIREQVAADMPWDEFVRAIITAKGSTFENGAANFYSVHQEPTDMAEAASQAFLGLSINCAKCHNHPLEKWTNDQYYGMANMFARVRGKGWGGDFRNGDGKRTIFSDTQGELLQPSVGKPQPPRPLDGEPLEFNDPTDRRIHLAKWLTSPENPYFTRSIVNRVWANYFGVGLVESVDDMRSTNPASNEELLQATADFLVKNDYDLKALMRAIMRSAAYQRSSTPLAENIAEKRFYSRYYPRRLPAEVMLDALSKSTAAPTTFKDKPGGTRALQLADSAVESYFLSTFGRPERLITCACERTAEPSMTQVLHIYNGDTIQQKLTTKGNRVDQLLANERSDAAIIESVYLSTLSRFPTAKEKKNLLPLLATDTPAEKRLAVEDLFWAILSSREFLFNH